MEKQTRSIQVPFKFDWTYGIELKKLKEDIETLEKLGATSIMIETEDNYGGPYIKIEAHTTRLETDEELQRRIDLEKEEMEYNKKRDLELLAKLKSKYENL